MEVLTLAVFGAVNIFCFVIGAKVGQTVSKGETVVMPTVNPMEMVRQHKAKQKAVEELDKLDAIMRNIESYDGTSNGQRDVPKG